MNDGYTSRIFVVCPVLLPFSSTSNESGNLGCGRDVDGCMPQGEVCCCVACTAAAEGVSTGSNFT